MDSTPTAPAERDEVHRDAAPHEDVGRDDEAEVLGHERASSMRRWRSSSIDTRSARKAKYTSVNAITLTSSVMPIDASIAGLPPARITVGSWCSEFIQSTDRCTMGMSMTAMTPRTAARVARREKSVDRERRSR